MTVVLAETPGGDPTLLPPGTDAAALHDAVATAVTALLGSAHAALFARPAPSADGQRTVWTAPGAEARRFADLSGPERAALLRAAGSIVSDLRRLVESGRAPVLAAAWPAIRSVSGPAALFAVDGRPVLAPWARPGATDLLGPHDDGVPWRAPPRVRWLPPAVALASVALLALAAGLLLPAWAPWAQAPAAMCRIDDGQMDLMRRGADAAGRGEELKKLLAAVNDDIGRQQLLCPLPQAEAAVQPPPVPPPVPPPPPPPPAPRAELPAERWDQHDLAMLDGCWHSTTQMTLMRESDGLRQNVREWRLCFDRRGRGQQTIRLTDGTTCVGPLGADFRSDNQLRLSDAAKCNGPGLSLRLGRFDCSRISDEEAQCIRTDLEGPAAGQQSPGRFHR